MKLEQNTEAAETVQTTDSPAVVHARFVRPIYKSDRTEGRKPLPDAIHLKTLCTGCKNPMDCYWPPTTTFGGAPCTAQEYMEHALRSKNVGIYCDDCMEKMPDVKLEDLCYE